MLRTFPFCLRGAWHTPRVGQSSSRSPHEIAKEISSILIILNNLCRCRHAFIFYGSLARLWMFTTIYSLPEASISEGCCELEWKLQLGDLSSLWHWGQGTGLIRAATFPGLGCAPPPQHASPSTSWGQGTLAQQQGSHHDPTPHSPPQP